MSDLSKDDWRAGCREGDRLPGCAWFAVAVTIAAMALLVLIQIGVCR